MAFTAVAAIVAGSEVTATLVLAAAVEVGTAMTVVGVVTGSKELVKIGGVMSLVGGVGGLVNGAISGAVGEGVASVGGAESLESASALADSAYGGAAATEAAQQAGISQMEGGIVADAVNPAVGSELATTMQTPAQEMAQGVQGTQAAGAPAVSGPVDSITQQAPAVNGPTGAQAPNTPYDINLDPNSTPTDLRLQAGAQTAPQGSSSFFDKFGTWVTNNKTLFSSGLQLAGGMMSGANQRQMWDEKMQLGRDQLAQTSHGSEVGMWAPRASATPGIINGGRA